MPHDFLSALLVLLIVMDPLGNVPIVLSLLRDTPKERRFLVITRECLFALAILLVFMLVGDRLLHVMHLTDASLEIAGGVILFLIAMGMAFPSMGVSFSGPEQEAEPMLVPLAIPMIAGPSSLATVLLLASRQPERAWTWAGAITLSMVVVWLVLLSANGLARRIGKSGLIALERLMGLLLAAMAVQMLISGLRNAFPMIAH
ncbi:membrane protein, MarC family [Rhodoferax sp. OV413]|uniref:MarC family protein n=1 Tax=Rhodoferax sp. OV413 TaxID=1855285 RepID=UPI00088B6997|nr:MarC family protein [Rhodoferax sp. OV413]SDP70905.1 membrane protein, MarC family [Rhodoferax sp. OV413]